MSEKPILFSGPMVRALLDERKTQTRRVVKPEIAEALDFMGGGADGEPATSEGVSLWWGRALDDDGKAGPEGWQVNCAEYPEEGCVSLGRGYGKPGDLLWVRETWQAIRVSVDPETGYGDDVHHAHDIPPAATSYWSIAYAADPGHDDSREDRGFPWRPSIHMPRWASRITLRVTSVRVERLQEISEDDAMAEGIEHASTLDPSGPCRWRSVLAPSRGWDSATAAFAELWDSINDQTCPWESNPWVWAVEFERCEAGLERGRSE